MPEEQSKPKVLLLEDHDGWAEDAMKVFGDKVVVYRAKNVEEAIRLFDASVNEEAPFAGMYVDAVIKGRNGAQNDTTLRFVEYVASTGYSEPMVTAASYYAACNRRLFAAGCNVMSQKANAPTELLRHLGFE